MKNIFRAKAKVAAALTLFMPCFLACSLVSASDDNDYLNPKPKVVVIKTKGYLPKPVTAESQEGEKTFKVLNCMACHSIHNVGGRLGPMLDGIGEQRTEEYLLFELINTPEAKNKFAKMTGAEADYLTHPRITEASAKKIVSFLLTLPEPPGGFILMPHTTRLPSETRTNNPKFSPVHATLSSKEGRELYDKLGCAACHSISNLGGWLGPQLDGVGGRCTREYIMSHITAPGQPPVAGIEQSVTAHDMPAFNLSKEDLQKIADYLMTLPNPKKAE